MLSHELGGKAWEPRLRGPADTSLAPAGCPTAFEQIGEVTFKPESSANIGEEPGEAVRPPAAPGQEAQEQMHEQRGPDLPLVRAFVKMRGLLTDTRELAMKLAAMEKELDRPARLLRSLPKGARV